ncbi:MAG TPA: Gfo/Idh/MocA family oxidoreductase [Candidatus Baltobacterales bacterium]|nr:Gfo/Idh/MocA family oxidoreductase [Candidatus Baltobacterales bacterium]
MTQLRIALIGAGRAGRLHARNVASSISDARLTAVVDTEATAAAALAHELGAPAHGSLEDVLDECDAVVITTPTFTHADYAVQAAKAGKHVFCEKPLALNLHDCDRMIEAARSAGVVLQVGFVRRFQPEFVEARRRIEAGGIGEPMVVKSLTRGPGLPPPWAWDIELSNGMLAEVNSHDFDCVRWLVGSDIHRVYAETSNVKGAARGVQVDGFYDNAVVALRFKSGAIGTIDGTCPADYGYDARVEILGSEGLLVIGDLRSQTLIEVRDRDHGAVTPVFRSWPERFESAYRAEIRAFVAAALGGKKPVVGGEDGRAVVHAVIAANRSWREERPVLLSEVQGID